MKHFKSALIGIMALGTATASVADTYPSRTIRIVVPAAAGGSTDLGARAIAHHLTTSLGQPVIVENRGGGGGRIGAYEVSRSTPDGYTLLYANSITHALLPGVTKKLQYDALKDFIPAGQLFWYSTMIVCNPSVPFNDLTGMIKYARGNPNKLSMATAGPGAGNHFSSALIASMAGIKVTHVPYRGNAPAVQDVLAGVTDCIHITEAKPYLDTGRLKGIATTGRVRDPRFPNIPTVEESGLKGYDVSWWQAIMVPAGTPPEVVNKLSAALKQAVSDPKVRSQTIDAGFVPKFASGQEVKALMQQDMEKFKKIAVEANIELD